MFSRCNTLFRNRYTNSRPVLGVNSFNPRRPMVKAKMDKIKEDLAEAEIQEEVALSEYTGRRHGPTGSGKAPKSRVGRLVRTGEAIADEVKTMTDAEWTALSLAEKQAFTTFVASKLRSAPSELTEQQRRRYFETTLVDPTNQDPHHDVTDKYQRLKMGLPLQLPTDRLLGVTDAMYEQGDASMFDPDEALRIENAMTNVKQVFVDYVRKKREGKSTEAERRQLANMSADLNHQTQKHLANMFKYAEGKVQEVVLEERRRQLRHIAAIRQQAADKEASSGASDDEKGAPPSSSAPSASAIADRKATVRRTLREVYGLDMDTIEALHKQMRLQEEFLRRCEVIARLTTGQGFHHTAADESLDRYTEEVKKIYSMDPERLGQVDAVQYLAATEGAPPVDWAARWYENSLLLPLQQTPEFKALQRIREEEHEMTMAASARDKLQARGELGDEAEGQGAEATNGDAQQTVAAKKEREVVSLVSRMFLSPEDERIRTIHAKRLRYIAYLHMESQIKRMRKNSRIFEGVELTAEAEQCRTLYEKLQEKRQAFDSSEAKQREASFFDDPEARAIFEQIQSVADAIIEDRLATAKADSQATKAQKLMAAMDNDAKFKNEVKAIRDEKKRAQVLRLLNLMERDVREDILFVENMSEADRPPPLPVPEPMSYVSAADVMAWKALREKDDENKSNPFKKGKGALGKASFFGQPWEVPDKPMLFWGTGTKAVEQALQHAAEDAERRRNGQDLAPPYPCAENPWGWRLAKDILDEDDGDLGDSLSAAA